MFNEQTLEIYGAVSAETAFEMVQGAQHKDTIASLSCNRHCWP